VEEEIEAEIVAEEKPAGRDFTVGGGLRLGLGLYFGLALGGLILTVGSFFLCCGGFGMLASLGAKKVAETTPSSSSQPVAPAVETSAPQQESKEEPKPESPPNPPSAPTVSQEPVPSQPSQPSPEPEPKAAFPKAGPPPEPPGAVSPYTGRSKKRTTEVQKIPAEDSAAQSLRYAKTLLKDGKTDIGKYRLERIVKDYPDTKAAKEAVKLLEELR
jgi:hypothetical protein